MAEFIRDPLRPRRKPSKDEKFYTAWGKAHDFCAACGRTEGGAFGLSTHHIVKQGRAHEACNLLRLCLHPCHDLAEGMSIRVPADTMRNNGTLAGYWHMQGIFPGGCLPKITIGIALSMKLRCDPAEVDMSRLQELRGSRLPDPAEIPTYFVDLYRRNRPEEHARKTS